MSSLDDRIRSALDRVLVSLKGQLEADLTASASDILRAASETQARLSAEAVERAAADVRHEAEQELSALREEFERQRDDLQKHSASELAGLQQVIADVREQLAAAQRDVDEGRREHEDLSRQLESSLREGDEVRREAETARGEVESARREIEDAMRLAEERQRHTEDALREVDHERQRADLAQRESGEVRGEAEEARRELQVVRDALAQADRLAAGLKTLDDATSLGDVLDGLTRLACQETGRAVVFLVREDRLRGWRAVGFDAVDMIVGSDLPSDHTGVVGEAAKSGVAREHQNGDTSSLPAFATGNGSRHALALPVVVGGSVIAVLYVDVAQTDTPEEPRWPVILDVMARHAGRVLEAMTLRQAAALWTDRATTQSSPQRNRPAASGGLQ